MPQIATKKSVIEALPIRAELEDQFGRFSLKPQSKGGDLTWHHGEDCALARQRLLQQRPATIWLTGLSGAGKSTIAFALEKILIDRGQCCFVLDGDNLRHHLNCDLGFLPEDRRENIRRAAEVAHLINEAGLIAIIAFISPFENDRAMAREIIQPQRFIEVHVNTSKTICEARDTKGLYARARRGEISEFTGISSPYENPLEPQVKIDTELLSIEGAASMLHDYLVANKFIE
ncbi:MAG: adenylyl-sulfate kinase [Pseudomonadota bacterium]